MPKKQRISKLDIILLPIFPIVAFILSFVFKANFFISILLFFGLPSLYFSFRRKEMILKTVIFALILTPLGFVIDYINHINNSWYLPTMFPFRLLGVPVEDVLWIFFLAYFSIIFYEHFFKKSKPELINKKMKSFISLFVIFAVLVLILNFTNIELFKIKYAYFWTTFVFLFIPIVIFLYYYPKFIPSFVKVAAYFFIPLILMEIVGLHFEQWFFIGSYIGWIELFGYRFAFEEFFFLILMSPIACITYYKFFNCDRK